MTKSQKEMTMLVVIVAAMAAVLAWYFIRGGKEAGTAAYEAKAVDTRIPEGLFNHPQYPKLTAPVPLPVEPGPLGNAAPFGSGAGEEE